MRMQLSLYRRVSDRDKEKKSLKKKIIWDKQNPVDWRGNKEHTARELNLSTAKPRSFSFS